MRGSRPLLRSAQLLRFLEELTQDGGGQPPDDVFFKLVEVDREAAATMLPVLDAMDPWIAKVIEGDFEGCGDFEWIELQVVGRGDDPDEGHDVVAVHRMEIVQRCQFVLSASLIRVSYGTAS